MSDRASTLSTPVSPFQYASPRTMSQALEEVESDPDVIAQAMAAAEQTPVGVGASQTAGTPARRVPLQPDVQVVARGSGSSSSSSSSSGSRRRRRPQTTPPGPNPPPPTARPRLTTPAGQRVAQKRPRRRLVTSTPTPSPIPSGSRRSSSSSSGGESATSGATNRRATQNLSPSDLSEAFNRLTQRERERMAREKRNVQSVTHTSTFTTVFKKGRAPQVVRHTRRA